MFYLQREPTPVWIVTNSLEQKGLIIKTKEQFCNDIEDLYDKYKPALDDPLYQSFYDFVMEIICKGLCNATIERMFALLAEQAANKLKKALSLHISKVTDILAASDGEEDPEEMKELFLQGSHANSNEIVETEYFQTASKRKHTQTEIAVNDGGLEDVEFQYFEKVYQGTYQDEYTQTNSKRLAFCSILPITVKPFNTSFTQSKYQTSPVKKQSYLPNIECLSEIEGDFEPDQLEIRSVKNALSRSQSIVISEKYLAPILIKQRKQETNAIGQFANLVESFEKVDVKDFGGSRTDRTEPGREARRSIVRNSHHIPTEQAEISTKESMRKKVSYKLEYQKKIRTGMLMMRTNPYQVRRRT